MQKFTKLKMLAAGIFFAALVLSMSGSIIYAADDSNTVIANDENGIPDKALYDAVLKEADSNGDGVLTKGEAELISELVLWHNDIKDITGIQYFTNLEKLDLCFNKISDISNSLSSLVNLKRLYLSHNEISDVSKLSSLVNLVMLELDDNQIVDMSSLNYLNKLEELYLDNNQISEISDLSNLSNLHHLRVNNNQIKDVSLLSSLKNSKGLWTISLDNNQISDISSLGELSDLQNFNDLSLNNNQIKDISCLNKLKELTYLSLNNNEISDINCLSGISKYLFHLYLNGNQITDISVVSEIEFLSTLYLSNNQISDISCLGNSDNLDWLDLSNNKICDINSISSNRLMEVNLSNNQIKDISVFGRLELNDLKKLNLSNNQIKDISAFGRLELNDLRELNLSNNQIRNVSSLSNLSNLDWLDLSNNKISDISVLKDSILVNSIEQKVSENPWGLSHVVQYDSDGFLKNRYKIADGNRIPTEQAQILPEVLLNAPIYASGGYPIWGSRWLDVEEFVDINMVISEDGNVHCYINGIEDNTYIGIVTEKSTGRKYWFNSGVVEYDKQVYDPYTDAWYWLDADGTVAVNKDVYVPESNENRENGKWVRYDENGRMVKGEDCRYGGWYRFDEITGEMIKGWYTTGDGRTYYYDSVTGQMKHGSVEIDGKLCAFDDITGVAVNCAWYIIDGNEYWYEGGIRQGIEGRGKEIYDAASDAWYWLDSIDGGKKAVSKDVYQESYAGIFADREDGTGKWVRYDAQGHMIKGWSEQNGSSYYFDLHTGAMAKGEAEIDGVKHYFNMATGIQEW